MKIILVVVTNQEAVMEPNVYMVTSKRIRKLMREIVIPILVTKDSKRPSLLLYKVTNLTSTRRFYLNISRQSLE